MMSRLRIPFDISERVLSHSVGNEVTSAYDHHDYTEEKRHALAALGDELDRILGVASDETVVEFRARA